MIPSVHFVRLESARESQEPLVIERDGLTFALKPEPWGEEAIAKSPSRTALALLAHRHGLNLRGIDRVFGIGLERSG